MNNITPETGVIIVDHGSRRAEANEMINAVASAFAAHTGAVIVEPAHMELAMPGIPEAFDRCVERGATHVVICLYFLSPGRHSREDIPTIAAEAASKHPGVTWAVTEPLGVDARIADVMMERVAQSMLRA